MDNRTQNPLTALGTEPASNDNSSIQVDEAPSAKAQSRAPSSRRPSSEASSFSHGIRRPAASTLHYHLWIEDDLRGVGSRTQGPPHGTKRPRPGSTSEEESDVEPKPKRDKLLQELDELQACSHSEPGLPNETEEMTVNVTSTQSDGQRILSAPDLGLHLRSPKEDDQQTETNITLCSSSHRQEEEP